MRLTKPRFAPLTDAELTPEQAEALEPMRPGPVLNIFRTLAHAPKALAGSTPGAAMCCRGATTCAPREREIVILRTGFLCKSGYEWTQHTRIGLRLGPDRGRDRAHQARRRGRLERRRRGPDPRQRRAARRPVHRRGDLGRTRQALQRQAAHGRGLHHRPVHPGLDDPEHLRGAARRRPDPRPRPEGLLTMAGRLEGKIAVVVGAGQTPGETVGNGRAMAMLFAREGAQVLCVDRVGERAEETAAMIVEEGGVASASAPTSSRPPTAPDRRGGQGALWPARHPDQQRRHRRRRRARPTGWRRRPSTASCTVNLKGMWLTIKAALPVMREQGGGAIVNISSLAARAGGIQLAYEVSKAGVNRLTTSVAQSNARYGVRCNAIMMGFMDTPMAVAGIATATGRPTARGPRRARRARAAGRQDGRRLGHRLRGPVPGLGRSQVHLRRDPAGGRRHGRADRVVPVSPAYRPDPRFPELGAEFADPVAAGRRFPQTILRFRNDRAAATVGLDTLTDAEWIAHFGRFEPLPGEHRSAAGAALPRPPVPHLQPRARRRPGLHLRPDARGRNRTACSTWGPRARARRPGRAPPTGG